MVRGVHWGRVWRVAVPLPKNFIIITRGNGTLVHIRTNFGFDVEGLNAEVMGLNAFQPHSH